MKSTNNHRTLTALVVISAIAAVLTGSAVHMASAQLNSTLASPVAAPGQAQSSPFDQKGNIADKAAADQDQECKTAGGSSPITGTTTGSCTASSSNSITESGGVLNEKKSER